MKRTPLLLLAAAIAAAGATPAPGLAQTTTRYGYDTQGQVRTVTRPGQTVTYDYDAAANRTQMTATTTASRQAAAPATTAAKTAPPSPPPPSRSPR